MSEKDRWIYWLLNDLNNPGRIRVDSALFQCPCLSGVQAEHVTIYLSFGEGRRVERSTTPGFSHAPAVLLSSSGRGKRRGRSPNQNKDKIKKKKAPQEWSDKTTRIWKRAPGKEQWLHLPPMALGHSRQYVAVPRMKSRRLEAFSLCVQTSDLTVLGLSD